MPDPKHTRLLPFRAVTDSLSYAPFGDRSDTTWIEDAKGNVCASTHLGDLTPELADFFVLAINSHYELIEALKKVDEWFDSPASKPYDTEEEGAEAFKLHQLVTKALSKANGETEDV